jgi:hypothetical protein
VLVVLVIKVVLEEVVVVAELLEGPVEVVDVVEIVGVALVEEEVELEDDEDDDKDEDDDEDEDDEDDEAVWVGQVTAPFKAYKLNWKGPPQNAVPVVDAPTEPLQTSVQA